MTQGHCNYLLNLSGLFGSMVLALLVGARATEAETTVPNASQPASTPERKQNVARGEAFLASLFDPTVNLLPEFRGSKTYWLFHDNYLAARMLANTRPELSRQIDAALVKFGVTNSGKIEIVFNQARQPLPFRAYQLTNVAVIDGKRIRTEALTTNLLKGWEQYADLLLLASIAQARSAPQDARRNFDRAAAMWDGHGFSDRAAKAMGIYSTYKLALYLIAAARLKLEPPHAQVVLDRLLSLQGQDGGWITDYKEDQPAGLANVETTCLALLALRVWGQNSGLRSP